MAGGATLNLRLAALSMAGIARVTNNKTDNCGGVIRRTG